MNVPVDVNFWIRSLPISATYTFPSASVASAPGEENCPGPAPADPQRVTLAPAGVNTLMRLESDTARYMFPPAPAATPVGLPPVPQPNRNACGASVGAAPQPLHFCMRLFHESAT